MMIALALLSQDQTFLCLGQSLQKSSGKEPIYMPSSDSERLLFHSINSIILSDFLKTTQTKGVKHGKKGCSSSYSAGSRHGLLASIPADRNSIG